MTNPAATSCRLFLLIAVALLAALVFVSPEDTFAGGAVTVTKTADTADGTCDADCSLREAVILANASPRDINLPAGTYVMSIDDPLEENNAAMGDLDIRAAYSIIGAGADTTIIDGSGLSRIFHLATPAAVNISGVTIRNGHDGFGGGIYVAAGTLTLDKSTVSGNVTNVSGNGGGIVSQATVVITNSTISGNTATGAYGGGIYAFAFGTVNLTNSTVSGNTSLFGGGGIFNGTPVATTLTNVTMSNNTSTTANSGGAIRKDGTGGSVTLHNTIVANSPSGGNCFGTISSTGNNIDSGNTCALGGSGDVSTDPMLGALALNAPGKTETHALLPNSPAINGGGNCPPPTTDQRGVTRPLSVACDIGAYEADPRGDTDCSGDIDGSDLVDVLRHVSNVGTSAACLENGNVDGVSGITTMDALLIVKYWAGLLTSFPTN